MPPRSLIIVCLLGLACPGCYDDIEVDSLCPPTDEALNVTRWISYVASVDTLTSSRRTAGVGTSRPSPVT